VFAAGKTSLTPATPRWDASRPEGATVQFTRAVGWLAIVVGLVGPRTAAAVPQIFEQIGAIGSSNTVSTRSIVASPDGSYLYEANFSGSVVVFGHDPSTGGLVIVDVAQNGMGGVSGLDVTQGIAISPDGAHVYATGYGADALVVFSRNAATGALTFVERKDDGIGGVDGLGGAFKLAVSPDGAHVYVLGIDEDAVAVFSRNATTGALTFVEVQRDGVGGVDGIARPWNLALSPDGAHLYVTSTVDNAVAVFARNATTGALAFVEAQRDGVAGVDGLAVATGVAVTADGGHVYAAGYNDGALAVFARNAATGALTFVEVQRNGVGGVEGIQAPGTLALSPDGAHVYAGGEGSLDGVAIFARNAGTGALTFVEREDDGFVGDGTVRHLTLTADGTVLYAATTYAIVVLDRNAGTGGLTKVERERGRDLTGPGILAMSPDGAHLYMASQGFAFDGDSIAALTRDAPTGALAWVDIYRDGDLGVDGLGGIAALTVSADGAHVYSAAGTDDAVAAFSRNASTGALTFLGEVRDGVGGVDGLDGAHDLAVSPDGAHVYAVGAADDAVAVFSRNAGTGALTFVEVKRDGVGGVDGLDGVTHVAVSPDGAHVYTASGGDRAVAVFGRNAGTGALTFVQVVRAPAGAYDYLEIPQEAVVSADGANLYVPAQHAAAGGDDDVAVFSRDAGSGMLTLAQVVRQNHDGADGVRDVSHILLSPDGSQVFLGSFAEYTRDPSTGMLAFVALGEGYYGGGGFNEISPDGRFVYRGGSYDGIGIAEGGYTGCPPAPLTGCKTAARGSLKLRDATNDNGDRATWTWSKGAATSDAEFGPTHYAFCVYDESGPPALVLRALVPAGGTCPTPSRPDTDCYIVPRRYVDLSSTPEGVKVMKLVPGGADAARISLRAIGRHVGTPALPLGLPVRAQLQRDNGDCWEATYSAPTKNEAGGFVAKPD
jgi:6-phosphogluconolactonase (cycloisomerase 2 family)